MSIHLNADWKRVGPVILLLILQVATSHAQKSPHSSQIDSPEALAEEVLHRFTSASAEDFNAIYPFEDGREFVQEAIKYSDRRIPGFYRILKAGENEAILMLSGHLTFGNSGDETSATRGFSELYQTQRNKNGRWYLSRQIPLDTLGMIQHQVLNVDLMPGKGMQITDTLEVLVNTSLGWAARLNHNATITSLSVDGQDSAFEFGGALLWVDAPMGRRKIVLSYAIDVAGDSTADANSGRFEEAYGHVRNQYFWHPFLWFDRGSTHFSVTVRAPLEYHIATDLDQLDFSDDQTRTVKAKTIEPTFALSLFYDRAWQPSVQQQGSLKLNLFTTPDFTPLPDSLYEDFLRTYTLLNNRFGPPSGGSVSVVQSRARNGAGWNYRTNHAMTTPRNGGGQLMRSEPYPRAWFGHEVAHGWTSPTGPAANFLREGWATYAESILLKANYGPEVEQNFWESQRNRYETWSKENQNTILNDPHNSGIAYHKGAWIFRMLEHMLGTEVFNKGLRAYIQIRPGDVAGTEEFIAALSDAASYDVSPLIRPWIEAPAIPDIQTHLKDKKVIFTQRGPVFEMQVAVELSTLQGVVRRSVLLSMPSDTLDVSDLAPVTAVRIDPEHQFLLKRNWGNAVRFQLRAPDAKEVYLSADFANNPVSASRDGDFWIVDVLLTEGRYYWRWIVDGERRNIEAREVLPVLRLRTTYPD